MEVNHQTYVLESADKPTGVVNFWMQPLVGLHPLSIQVEAGQVGPKIAIYDSIRVKHG